MQNRVFRLFVSSTFEDFAAEREKLRQHVFPELEALCRDLGAQFEAVDLRWGISAEAASAQDTMAICLQELDRCLATGLRPSLLILLGDRYGWRPLPDEIHPHDFDKIVHRVRERCGVRPLALLKRHYPLDKNTRDPVHRLRVFGANQDKSARFEKIENKIRSVLRFGADALSPQRRRRLIASATEREIARGLLERRGLARHALCCIRSLQGIRREELGRPWIDLDDEGNVDGEAQARLTLLKRRIIARLGKAACSLLARLVDDRVDENYLKRFCAAVRRHLISDISKQASAWGAHSSLDKEIQAHRQFGLSRAQTVVGRQKSLREIRRYLSHSQQAPLIVSGESGIGKSALIAAALKELDASNSRPIIIRRFIGATPQSSQGQSLVSNLYNELARRLKIKQTLHDRGFLGLAHAFRSALVAGKTRRPVVISIDALDQFPPGDDARELHWLPPRLPANRWLIVSAVQPSYCLRQLERKYPKAPAIKLKGLEVAAGEELLKLWLEEKGRRLQRHQRRPHESRINSLRLSALFAVSGE